MLASPLIEVLENGWNFSGVSGRNSGIELVSTICNKKVRESENKKNLCFLSRLALRTRLNLLTLFFKLNSFSSLESVPIAYFKSLSRDELPIDLSVLTVSVADAQGCAQGSSDQFFYSEVSTFAMMKTDGQQQITRSFPFSKTFSS